MALSLVETRVALGGPDGIDLHEGPGGCLVIESVDPTNWLTTWQSLRDATPRTGRYPLAIGNDFGEVGRLYEELERERQGVATPFDQEAYQREIENVDPWAVLGVSRHFSYEVADAEVRYYVPEGLGDQAVREVPPPRTVHDLARWSYDLLRQRPQGRAVADFDYLVSPDNWYVPEAVALVLLPTPHPWMSGRWEFYGFWGEEATALPAAMREWHIRWGAEPVAAWGTVLQFVVSRPPSEDEDAWRLAEQLLTIARSNQEKLWQLALALPRGHHWFLHSRP